METANFIVYKSSAGSGKTFTLVKEYLKLALANPSALALNYKGILAITFTNKAASEMKWRIIKALKEISSGSNTMLSELVAGELNISTSDLQNRAGITLTSILHNYSDFSVGTIDSFTHRIIRTFSLDLKLPPNFQIETDSDTVFRKVISILINNLGKDKLITDYLVHFSLAQLEENKNWDPELALVEFIKEINKEGAGDLVKQLHHYTISDFETIRNKLSAYLKNYQSFLKQEGEKALALIHARQLTATAFASGGAGIYNFYVKLAEQKATTQDELFGANVIKTLNEDKWHAAKSDAVEKQAIDSIKEELKTIASSVLSYLQENQERYNVFSLIYKNIYAIGLVNELAKLTEQYKQEENILFISEFNERISGVVNNEPTPFIFERLGERYKHFLLDEFQDTSAMQWQNMLPLVDNALGNGNLNLIVGDGKQSIYRWRNADVEQFVSLPSINFFNKNELLIERENALIRNFREETLNKNYRSESAIVKFNNELFGFLSENVLTENMKRIYHKQAQEYKPADKGYVSIEFPELAEGDADVTNTGIIMKHITNAIEAGYDYSDICVIVRVNRHGNTVANFLIEHAIPVVSSESLLLGKAQEVNVLIHFLKYIANHKDLVSASVVLNFLHEHRFCDEQQYVQLLRELNVTKTKTLFAVLAACMLPVNTAKIISSNLLDSCLEIISLLGLHKTNAPYIRFFLDEVLFFLHSNTSNTMLFIEWWEKRGEKASVIIPEGMNAVNIMTIHASKGLEFPVVITPYIGWDVESTESLWVDVDDDLIEMPVALINTTKAADDTKYKPLVEKERQQQAMDSLNMLYVDFTRAIERLHIISPELKRATKKNTHSWLKTFALSQAHYNDEHKIIEFGSLDAKINQHAKHNLQQLPAVELNVSGNTDIIEIKGSGTYNSHEEVIRARDHGILVHFMLSQVKAYTDVDTIVYRTVLSGDITEEEALIMSSNIKELISINSIAPYFSEGVEVKNELEILTAQGEILRPDRVVVIDTKAIVIDYKTGKKNPAKYHAQMRDYENALLSLGYTSVKKIILYINEREVEIIN